MAPHAMYPTWDIVHVQLQARRVDVICIAAFGWIECCANGHPSLDMCLYTGFVFSARLGESHDSPSCS
jgi:hypothetical protein